MSSKQHDFGPTASWAHLERRAELLRALRRFFDQYGFLEVETPLLSHDSIVDRHLDPLSVRLFDDPREPEKGSSMWLQTSPEFGMKRLVAAGAKAIYQITRAFRGGEKGRLHNPEFTIVEWYRAGDTMGEGMELLDALAQATLGRGPAERLSYGEAFRRRLGVDPHRCSVNQLKELASDLGCTPRPSWAPEDRDTWLDWLLVSHIEPALGLEHPVILFDYPASQAALARIRPHPVPVAERFELYVDGVELANGYHELLDPEILAQRARQANRARTADGKYRLPAESRLLAAMHHGLPPCTGAALGFDRLVMVAVKAQQLSEVTAFPIDRA
ncbi:MAG: EF-P lysine aminoacylase EpmA [Planctomycetota bacterium]